MKVDTQDPATDLSLNLAPMIDVVFLLLIFFMVATTFANQEKEMNLDLPTAESGEESVDSPDEIILNLLSDGRIHLSVNPEVSAPDFSFTLVNGTPAWADTSV